MNKHNLFSCLSFQFLLIFIANGFMSECAMAHQLEIKANQINKSTLDDAQSETYDIPKKAKIEFKAFVIEEGGAPKFSAEYCLSRRPDEIELRRQFRVSRRVNIKSPDVQKKYPWTPCFWEGIIHFEGKNTKWKFRLGSLIETTFPDGVFKVLGGDRSISPIDP